MQRELDGPLDRLRERIRFRRYSLRTEQVPSARLALPRRRRPPEVSRMPAGRSNGRGGAELLRAMQVTQRLLGELLYGTGLRIMEALRLSRKGCRLRPLGDSRARWQELLGHADVSTTMIYTHVLNRRCHGVASALDCLSLKPTDRAQR
ncbi:MAG TPA: hypothetical protein VFQ93_11475 [Casimicrobiaceae bacterium]|nr:hypothetical protein [Casimicrobiaceae bacterium]